MSIDPYRGKHVVEPLSGIDWEMLIGMGLIIAGCVGMIALAVMY